MTFSFLGSPLSDCCRHFRTIVVRSLFPYGRPLLTLTHTPLSDCCRHFRTSRTRRVITKFSSATSRFLFLLSFLFFFPLVPQVACVAGSCFPGTAFSCFLVPQVSFFEDLGSLFPHAAGLISLRRSGFLLYSEQLLLYCEQLLLYSEQRTVNNSVSFGTETVFFAGSQGVGDTWTDPRIHSWN